MIQIAALQLQTLPMSEAKLDYYFRACKQKNISIVILGEYVLNSFFKELEKMPLEMIKGQSLQKINILKKLSKEYNLIVIAPIIIVKDKKLYKSVAKFTPTNLKIYNQNVLISYKHWNESKFYSNDNKEIILPMFKYENMKFAIICGFEAHYDVFWEIASKNNVDVVLMPSVATFESHQRWSELLRIRAFTHNMYILRVNRVGLFKDKNHNWDFYGGSAFISPHGETEDTLGENEEMLVCTIDKKNVIEAKRLWKWEETMKNSGIIK